MDEIPILIRFHDIKPYNCKRNELLSSVFEEFKKNSGKLYSKFLFIYNSTILDQNKTLKEYNILQGDIINALEYENVLGGGLPINFTDVSKNIYIEQKFSKKVPDYKIASKGINVIGICKGRGCKAYNQAVICPLKEKKKFNLIEEKDDLECPKCRNLLIPKTLGFYSCEYKIKGKKYEKDNITSFELEDKAIKKDSIKYFDPEKNGNTIIIELIVEVINFL